MLSLYSLNIWPEIQSKFTNNMHLYFGARNQAFKGINSGLKPKLLWILNAINFLSSLYIPGEDWDL